MKKMSSDKIGMCMVVADEEAASLWVDGILQPNQGTALVLIPLGQSLEIKVTCPGFEDCTQNFVANAPLSYCYFSLRRKRHLSLVRSPEACSG